MNLKSFMGRLVLKFSMSFFPIGREKIITPDSYRIFHNGKMPNNVKESLVEVYQEVFAEHPWNEKWSKKDVFRKIAEDTENDSNSFIVVFHEEGKVKGFSWGTIIMKKEVKARVSRAMCVPSEEININLYGDENILYLDEFALAKEARNGIDPVRHILKKFLQYGYDRGIQETLFWSTPRSKIVPLAEAMGYEKCGKTFVRNKEIVFLINKNFIPLLKATKNLSSEGAQKIMVSQKRRQTGKQ